MKRTTILNAIILSLLFNFAASAQETNDKKHTFGLRAGLNASNFQGKDVASSPYLPEQEIKLNFHLGAFYKFQISNLVSFQSEALFSRKGNDYKSLTYIDIPLLVSINLVSKLSFELGPQMSYLLTAQTVSNEGKKFDSKYEHKSIDVSAVVGVTYAINDKISLGARYNYSLINTYKEYEIFKGVPIVDENGTPTGDRYFSSNGPSEMVQLKARNSVFQLTAGYSF